MRRFILLGVVLTAFGCTAQTRPAGQAAVEPPPPIVRTSADPETTVVDAADRSEADRQLDEGRHPAEMLEFLAIGPGMRVAELGAGTGYTTELLARSVAPAGVVYGHNDPSILERFAEGPWSERLKKPVMANVVRLDRPFDDPFPPEVSQLDAVIIVLFYHDTVWLNVDRYRMNRAVFDALKPEGIYLVVDHSSWPGRGTSEASTLHRIEEKLVLGEVERAGFKLADQAFFLRNPDDTRDWNASPREAGERRGSSDRFVLKFIKPVGNAPVASPVADTPAATP